MGRRRVLIVVVAIAASSCVNRDVARIMAARALMPPASFMCPDGAAVRILTDSACRLGVCGWSCAPDRWR